MRYLIIIAFVLAVANLSATIINIPDDFETIQAGIDEAEDGDTVLVAEGEYIENIDYDGKDIVIGSLFLTTGEEDYITETIIDGDENGSVVKFVNGETEDAILIGFTIQNGSGTDGFGGGLIIRSSIPIVRNCVLRNNSVNQ